MLPQNEKKRCSHEYLPFHSSHYAKTKVLFFYRHGATCDGSDHAYVSVSWEIYGCRYN